MYCSPIPPAKLRSVVPDALSIDTFDGSAWITVLVVDIAGARVRGVPYHPSLSSINLRTYVSHGGETGIYFIALEMDGQLSSWLARNGVDHRPWPLTDVDAEITTNTLFEAAGVPVPSESPTFHYSPQQYMAAKRLHELPRQVRAMR